MCVCVCMCAFFVGVFFLCTCIRAVWSAFACARARVCVRAFFMFVCCVLCGVCVCVCVCVRVSRPMCAFFFCVRVYVLC